MPPLKKVIDQNDLVETKKFHYAVFPFEKFNPVQSRVFEFYDQDANIIISAATSSGKTICAEQMLAYECRKRGGKGLYLGPLKALTQEKIDDWCSENHHFKDLKISICTSDYRLTADRKKELEEANLILMTSEMLNSRCRNDKSENNQFLRDLGTVVVDESHLLTVPNRGDHLEVGLMKLTKINPNARIVFLSATMPNVNEVSEWVSYSLNQKETYLLESQYRPCPLTVYYEKCWDGGGTYENNEILKTQHALSLIQSYPDDKFLIFAHTKRTGELMKRQLKMIGEDCEFHNADLDKDKRLELQKKFKTDPKFRCIVATSTLAWGLNLPARRVIILGVHRGLNEVDNFDIQQMVGRAGRVGYDPRGDAYILLPQSNYEKYKNKLKKPQRITSHLLANVGATDEKIGHYKVLAFHLVSEIHHGNIKTREDILAWYSRSLAHWQEKSLDDEILESTVDLLKNCGAVVEEDGFKVTAIGRISSMFYYSPFDVADLRKNFSKMFENHRESDDYYVSLALGNTDTYRFGIISNAEKEAMGVYLPRGINMIPGVKEPAVKAGFAYYEVLRGANNPTFAGFMRNVQWDFPRTLEVLNAIDSMSAKWGKKEYLRTLSLRIRYGVRAELIDLCEIPSIGKVRSEKLYAAKIRTKADVIANPSKVQEVLKLNQDKIKEICEAAAMLDTI
jgi:replicative superfamily II helicase